MRVQATRSILPLSTEIQIGTSRRNASLIRDFNTADRKYID